MGKILVLGGAGYLLKQADLKRQRREAMKMPLPSEPAKKKSLGDVLDVDDIHVEFAPDLVAMALDPATGLDARIANMRNHVAASYGLILPEIRLTDDGSLGHGVYRIRIQGVEQAKDHLRPEGVLALIADNREFLPPGEDVREPVYGAPARWIPAAEQEEAALSGSTVVTPTEVLATHLLEVIKRNFGRLMSLRALRRLLEETCNLSDPVRADANRRILDELIPDKVPIDLLLSVLRLLLEERVSIRNLLLIVEAIAEARNLQSPEAICEHVRQRLGFQLIADYRRDDGTLPLLQLAPEWEDTFTAYQLPNDRGAGDIALPPDKFNRLVNNVAEKVARASESGVFPALITSTRRRRFLKTVLAAKGMSTPVLSFEEIGLDAKPAMVGVVPV